MTVRPKYLLALLCAVLIHIPSQAQEINGNDLGRTLEALHADLRKDYDKRVAANKMFDQQYRSQRREMVATIKKCNELSLLLYSQKQDFTFDLTYALQSVTKEYETYTSHRLPYDRIVDRLDWDLERYARLLETLRRIPPEIAVLKLIPDSLAYRNQQIDSLEEARMASFFAGRSAREIARLKRAFQERMRADTTHAFMLSDQEALHRDSCMYYAAELLKMGAANKDRIIRDSTHYQRAYLRLKESYDYAQDHYKQLQNRIFVQGQTAYPKIVGAFGRYWNRAVSEFRDKYDFGRFRETDSADRSFNSARRGPALFRFFLLQLVGLLGCILIAGLLFKLAVCFIKPVGRAVQKEQHLSIIFLLGILLDGIFLAVHDRTGTYLDSAANLVGMYLWLAGAVIAALLIRLKPNHIKGAFRMYLPLMVTAIVVIGLRIVFMPNSMMNIIFPPLLLVFFVWQLVSCLLHGGRVPGVDRLFGWITLIVFGSALGVSVAGYIFFALMIMMWWFFQMAIIHTLATLSHLLDQVREKYLPKRIEEYKRRITYVHADEKDKMLFGVTWVYDLLKDVVLPVAALLSVPMCIKYSLNVFDFTDLYETIFTHPFVNLANAEGVTALRLSFRSIVVGICMFFVFKYLDKAVYAIYQSARYSAYLRKTGHRIVRKNEINFSLAKSIISTLVWFVYIVIMVVMLRIPTASLTIIAGGLSAGIGIALKDVLNNFIYGIQLMSGRLRVGDWIECDGIRGKVTNIGYQCTQVETVENTVMSFLNETLFSKNFTNLTLNNSYEFVKIVVGVSYGTEVEKVREVLVEALQVLRTKDVYGREIVDPKKGIYVVFNGFGDSSVDIAVKQYVLVSERIGYVDRAREVIYDALGKAGISIPFPQRDIHIVSEE